MLAEKMKQRLQPYVDGDMAGFRMQVLPAHARDNWLPVYQFWQSVVCPAFFLAILVTALPLQHVFTATSLDSISSAHVASLLPVRR